MTAASRRGDSLAPSLFPFLAVLLCTMGALVLILMLLVAGAESSGKEAVKQVDEEIQWEQEKIQLIKNELHEKYEEAKIALEKKRLVLQNYEQHILELTEELEQLERTAQQTEVKVDTAKETQQSRDERREALEKQLAEAKKDIEKKLADPKGDKPIFAIIPYDGPNGTHRRPIYLECNSKGVVIQPEGVVLNPVDLRPPYGPGNPLDAVLRTIRAEFPATNGAVTSNPYPLLVVRPSGIRHFMMARAAMSGWDDQFGYELISEDLELTFPPSVPKLEQKIANAIEMARERQAALVMAMPKHYSPSQLDAYGAFGDGSGSSGGFGEEDLDFGSMAGNAGEDGSSGSTSSASGGRGGFSMVAGQAADGQRAGQKNGAGQVGATPGMGTGQPNPGQLTLAQAATADPSRTSSRQGLQPQRSGTANGSGSMSFFGSGGSADDPLAVGGASSRNRFGSTESGSGNGSSSPGGSGALADGGGGSAGGSDGSGGFGEGTDGSTNSSGGNSGGGAGGASGGTSGGGGAGGSAAGGQSGGQSGGSAAQGSASMARSGGSSGSSGSTFSGSQSGAESSSGAGGSNSIDASEDPAQAGGISSLNMNFSKNPNEATKPIAQSRGRDWAWRDGNRSKTAVIRAIRLQCYGDRWVLLPDRNSQAAPTIINLDGPLAQRAEKLAEAVTGRVDGWGVAVAGGHWAPVLHVEVASDAEGRFQQLQRLMEGSGIEVVRKATIAPRAR